MTTYHFLLFLGVPMTRRGVALHSDDLALPPDGLDGGVFGDGPDGTKGCCRAGSLDGRVSGCFEVVLALAIMGDVVAIFTILVRDFAGGTTGRASFKSERVIVVSLCVVSRQVTSRYNLMVAYLLSWKGGHGITALDLT